MQVSLSDSAIVNLETYCDIQDTKDYAANNAADFYSNYFIASFFGQLIAASILLRHQQSPFLTKMKSMLLAITIGVFQMANLFVFAIKAGQLFVENWVLGDELCKLEDCEADRVLRWELLAYGAANLLGILVMMPYLKSLTLRKEPREQRETLMTTTDDLS